MVIHLQHTFVALRAVVGSVGLCSQASCAHSYSSEFFALKTHYLWGLFLGFVQQVVILQLVNGSSLAFDEPVVEVTGLSRVLLVFYDLLVVKIFLGTSLLDIFGKELIIGHVPL